MTGWQMILDDQSTKKSSKKPICRITDNGMHWPKTTFFLLLTPYPWWNNGPIYDDTIYKGQAKYLANDKTHQGL